MNTIRPVYGLVTLVLLGALFFWFENEPEAFSLSTDQKSYADVMQELELAITQRNFRITGHNKVGSVIRERDQIEFPDFDTLQFCNLTHAKTLLELSPSSISWMPCNVAVRSEGARVIVTTHLLPTHSTNLRLNAFARTMNEELKAIVRFAVE